MSSVSNVEQSFFASSTIPIIGRGSSQLPAIYTDQNYPLNSYLQLTSPEAESNNLLNSLKDFLFKGLFAKLMFALIGVSFASKNSGRLQKSLLATLGFAFGGLFLKAEAWMEEQITKLIEPNAQGENPENSLFWSFKHTLVKTLSILMISIFGAGKKMYALGGHGEGPIDEILKHELIWTSDNINKRLGVSNAALKEQIKKGDTLKAFQIFSEWVAEVPNMSRVKGDVFSRLACQTGSLTSKYVLGCPNWYKARISGQGVALGILKDFALKVGIFTMSGLVIEYLAHSISYLIKSFQRPET